jgi:hypothetical protein
MSNRFDKLLPILNSRLVANQGLLKEEIDEILKLHRVRNCCLTLMEISDNKEDLRYLCGVVTQIDFQLQRIWKFKVDSNYHRFWELPKCECPKLDNMDVYGSGHRYIYPGCPLHGD